MLLRDFTLSDLNRVKEIHEAQGVDYKFPDLTSPLFVVTKVIEHEGVVQACGGMYLQAEAYLWISPEGWTTPQAKLDAIKALDAANLGECWLKGIDVACLYLPPGMERFGDRLVEDLGWSKDRDGWVTYSRSIE